MFIGNSEIDSVLYNDEDDQVTVMFKDDKEHGSITIHKDILNMVQSTVAQDGNIHDLIAHQMAKRFIAELASYDLEFYTVENIASAMRVLAHNLREEAIGKAFACTGALDMKLEKIL